ncbi:MAG TPA: hypothetical protein VN922_13535, partial [Bacteroidia bacterium]|nr:hypothetical protein [Bacteroidia bacterium]
DVVIDTHLSLIIAWRIASYHVPLVIMWIALMRLTMTKNSLKALTKKGNLWHNHSNNKDTTTDYNDEEPR